MGGRHRRGRHRTRSDWPLTVALTAAAVVVAALILWPDPDLSGPPRSAAVAVSPPAPAASPPPQPPPQRERFVTVQDGDSLAGIAAAHGTTWPRLATLNDLARPDRIAPGMRLQLPQE